MWSNTDTPLAYFISFRTYGTWLHGDKRGSIDRLHNRYGDPYLFQNKAWEHHNRKQLKADSFVLGAKERRVVEQAIRELCMIRKWHLHALNVQTNHVHTVVTAHCKPGLALNALKGNATRHLRKNGLWRYPISPWAAKGSKIRLWNEQSVANAIHYVLNGQGKDLPNFND